MIINTFLNRQGKPIIRKCGNCAFWNSLDPDRGYCTRMPLLFAYTLEPTNNAITKKHNLCGDHAFYNQQELQKQAAPATYDQDFLKQGKHE